MSKFHVGDRVRVVTTDRFNGMTGEVVLVKKNASTTYAVYLDEALAAGEFTFKERELRPEHIGPQPEPSFKRGDRVRVTQVDHPADGESGEIVDVSAEASHPYQVYFDRGFIEGLGSWDGFSGDQIEALADVQVPYIGSNVEDDAVNHPAHYTAYPGVEVIQITEHLNFCRGNAVKYIARAGLKDPDKTIEDLEKAAWYLDREIARLKREVADNDQ